MKCSKLTISNSQLPAPNFKFWVLNFQFPISLSQCHISKFRFPIPNSQSALPTLQYSSLIPHCSFCKWQYPNSSLCILNYQPQSLKFQFPIPKFLVLFSISIFHFRVEIGIWNSHISIPILKFQFSICNCHVQFWFPILQCPICSSQFPIINFQFHFRILQGFDVSMFQGPRARRIQI